MNCAAANEVLVGVFGRAGPQTAYKRDLINELNFAIYNKATGTLRTAGVSVTRPPFLSDARAGALHAHEMPFSHSGTGTRATRELCSTAPT